jgi:hypothetical protein
MSPARWLIPALAALAATGCGRDTVPSAETTTTAAKAPVPVEIVPAPEGEVPAIVKGELDRARSDGHRLLVYVGATWCEPCQRFHTAAAAGEMNAAFPGMRLLEFDLDRDRDRLQRAGYSSRMIPLFALPRADGTGSGEQIEGSIKGPGAVEQITPRLRALLAKGG